jgi:hypothetical protein
MKQIKAGDKIKINRQMANKIYTVFQVIDNCVYCAGEPAPFHITKIVKVS